MQNPSSLLKSSAAQQFRQSIKNFFNLPTDQPRLLTRQPLAQRRLFLHKAVKHHLIVFVQLRPLTAAAAPTEFRGVIHQFDHDHYLIRCGHVSYVFTIDQLQYLARL